MSGRPPGSKGKGKSKGKKTGGDQPDHGGPSTQPEDVTSPRPATAEEAATGTPIFMELAAVEIPSESVTKAEDGGLVKKLQGLTLGNDPEVKTPSRPGYGNIGDKIILRTNYFEINTRKDFKLSEYSLKYEPTETVIRRRRRLVGLILREAPFCDHNFPIANDGGSILVSTECISTSTEEPITGKVRYYEPDHDGPKVHAKEFTFTVSLVRIWDAEMLKQLISSSNSYAQFENKTPFLQALNVIMAHKPSNNDQVSTSKEGNKFFPLRDSIAPLEDLGGGLIALRGYFTSARLSTARLLLNINSITAVFQRPGSLSDFMEQARLLKSGGNSLTEIQQSLKSVRVEIRHLQTEDQKPKKAKKTVFGLATAPRFGAHADEVTFLWKTDKMTERISVREYFRKQYNITLKHPHLPVVNVGNEENPIYLPPEVCFVIPGQTRSKVLTGDQTAKLIKTAVRPPAHNARLLVGEGAEVMGIGSKDGPSLFGLEIKPKMLTVHGRLMRAPRLQYRDPKPFGPYSGSWNMTKSQFCNTPKLTNWSILRLVRPGELGGKHPDDIGTQICEHLRKCGILFDRPVKLSPAVRVVSNDFKQQLVQLFTHLSNLSLKPAIVLIMLPDDSSALYSTIKYAGDIICGVHTVCMLTKKVSSARDDYFVNVLHKINLKNGGDNQRLSPEAIDTRLKDKCMIVGIDVTHPSPGSREDAPSIAGVVASIDNNYGQYLASVRVQEKRKEMVTDLEEMIQERLAAYARKNRVYPARILIYRDGVSEGQYSTVLRDEAPAIQRAIARTCKAAKVTLVVVGKRHHTRFYPTRSADADARSHNCKPGTLVDRGVSSAQLWDFFLQAHAALHGTARPAHYVVLRDDNAFAADALHALTHNLCYLFGRATKAVSVCPPAYYADLLCERARCYLHDAFSHRSGELPGPPARAAGASAGAASLSAGAGPAQSAVAAGKKREGQAAKAPEQAGAVGERWDGKVHPRLQGTMFYI